MIENLNKLTFSRFGRVLRDSLPNRGFPKGDEWAESTKYFTTENMFFHRLVGGSCYLDFEIGMTVLMVRDKEQTGCFYLDKPVLLPDGAQFAIVPYQKECSVRVALPKHARLEQLASVGAVNNLKIGDRLRLGEIYTLFYHEEESGFLFKGEQHSMYELTYVDRGALNCVVDGNGVTLKQGQLMIFAPNQWHMQYTDLDTAARFLTIAFDLEGDLQERLHDRVFDLSADEAGLLTKILRECDRSDLYSGDFIRSFLKLLLLAVMRDAHGAKKRLKTPLAIHNENAVVSRALQFIAANVYEKLSVEIVAAEIGISTSHLTALFHRQLHISPGEYVRRVKLEESKTLIREGTMNFSQIASELKYSTIHHFSRQFKDKFGITPSEYAKSIQA
ncbi:MAG: AraC family transcriptional regulator [Oscillospiraceae bacterium]|nr:AraC family transcriptional regulator [Oscillospiraceae bacterium]